jgi:hypothetical protein
MSGKQVVVLALVVGMTVATAAWWFRVAHPDVPAQTMSINRTDWDPALDRVVMSGPMARPRDFFRIISRPQYLSVIDALPLMSDRELVLGLELNGKYLAYPINLLNEHELVREEIDGIPLLITW